MMDKGKHWWEEYLEGLSLHLVFGAPLQQWLGGWLIGGLLHGSGSVDWQLGWSLTVAKLELGSWTQQWVVTLLQLGRGEVDREQGGLVAA